MIIFMPPLSLLQGLFLVWACAYTSLGVALYSAVSLDFSQWDRGLGTVVGLMTRYYNLEELEKVDPTGVRLLVISFLLLALSSLTGYVSKGEHRLTYSCCIIDLHELRLCL